MVPDPKDEILIGYLKDQYVVYIATGVLVKRKWDHRDITSILLNYKHLCTQCRP